MKSLLLTSTALFIGIISSNAEENINSTKLCEYESSSLDYSNPKNTFEYLYADLNNESSKKCIYVHETLGGYHGIAKVEMILFRSFGEWRGGRAGTHLSFCKKTIFQDEKEVAVYECRNLASNR